MGKVNRRQHGEGSVYQRAEDGLWVAVADLGYREGRRDRRKFYGASPQEAMDKRARFEDRRRDGFVMPKGRPPYVSEWALHWCHNIIRPQVEATTWQRGYRGKIEDCIAVFFARTRLDNSDLTEELIEEFHVWMSRKGLSGTTQQHTHRLLSAALKAAVVRGRLARNPAANVKAPSRSTVEAVPPDEQEVRAILKTAGGWRMGARWVFGLGTGVRQGEALAVMWPLVDLDNGEARIEWEMTRLRWEHGCPDDAPCGRTPRRCPQRHGGGLQMKRPKTLASRAAVPLAPLVVSALRRWKREQAAERLRCANWSGWVHDCDRRLRKGELICPVCVRPSRPDLLAFSQPNGKPVDARRDYGDWCALLEAAGVEDHFRVHDARHAFGTTLLEAGVDLKVVSELMRHANPNVTRTIYQHVRPKLRNAAVDVIETALRSDS